MAGVSIRFNPAVFLTGGPLENVPPNKARFIMNPNEHKIPHLNINTWFKNRDPGIPEPTNSLTIILQGTSPSGLTTLEEFNLLPYNEWRGQIALEVERGMIQVINSTGGIATVTQIRNGTVT